MFVTNLLSSNVKKVLLLGLLLHGCAYLLPFLDEKMGLEFFLEGLKQLFKGRIRQEVWAIFAAFYIPVVTLPIFIARWFANKPLNKWWRIAIGLCLLLPHLGSMAAVAERYLRYPTDKIDMIGYGVWLLSYVLIALALFFKRRAIQQERELMEHLIE